MPRLAGSRPLNDRHGTHGDEEDPHAWLDPREAVAFADTVCRVLSELRPGNAAEYARGRDALQARLAVLDRDCAAMLQGCAGREFFVFHPAYGHFARRYGLVQVAVEDHGHEPGARHLAETIERAKAVGARAILVQPQFPQRRDEAANGLQRCAIVALTAGAFEDDKQRCAEAGMDDFLAKPIELASLVSLLSNWLAV